MRLIFGLWMLDGSAATEETLSAMGGAMQFAASPARLEIWNDGPVGLGVLGFGREGCGLGLSSEHTSSNGARLAGDVRLDEAAELARRLGLPASTDGEIAAGALGAWGADAPREMLGDFALAWWKPGERELLLARDAMGVRPLVYHHQPGQHLLFASFPQGIHGSGMVRRELNVDALAHQMLARTQAAETLSRGVLALPPGHTLQVSATGLRLSCYWKPAIQPCRHASPAAAAEELRHLLDRSVRSRVRARCAAKQPVAAHLSGGLDSSAIAVLAARALREQGRRLLAYSFLPNTPDGAPGQAKHDGEWPFVQAVLAQEPQIVWRPILPAPAADRWRGAMQADRVLSLGPDDPENAVCADACAHGAELVLSGWGGDEGATFNGRGALANALLGLRWGYLAQEMRALKRQRGFRTLGILYGDLLTPILPGWALERLENLRGRSGRIRVSLGDVLAPGLRERLQAEGGSAVAISPFVRRNQLSLLSSGHLSQRAANWASIGARYGLAFAFPLLDRRIVDFALALPPQWHLREGWKRRPFRDAMEGILPAPIQWRHTKLTPYPDSPLELVAERARLIGRLDELARHPLVCQVLDLDFVRRLAGSLAKPDIANPAPDSEALLPFVLVSIALQYGCYVEEHF